MRLHNPHPLKVVTRQETEDAYTVERRVHKALEAYAVGREWFRVDVATVRAAVAAAIKSVRSAQEQWEKSCKKRVAARVEPVAFSPELMEMVEKDLNSIAVSMRNDKRRGYLGDYPTPLVRGRS